MTTGVKIPKAPYYVLSNDRFMSGWGKARGLTNVCVVPCLTYDEAKAVAGYVETRPEQKYVRIVTAKPRNKPHWLLSVVLGWRGMAGLPATDELPNDDFRPDGTPYLEQA